MAEPATGVAVARVWSVGALVLAVADALAARFGACTVQGEISGFSRAASGHCYFTLKDAQGEQAALRCAMFRRAAGLLDFAPRDGQKVELRGRVAVYEARGELQLVVESMRALGAGSLYEQFMLLKARLEAQGLFDAARKRALPAFAERVGVVTSLGAAALHDILTALARRAPQVQVIVYPSLVQGNEAPAALVAAMGLAAARREVDVLILARGGGSLEDLWAFNDERVVRAVAASPIPLVCGVGHETDVTLADFAADLRAATPTAAAELAAPAQADELERLATLAQRVRRQMRRRLESDAQRLDQRALQLARPAQALARHGHQLHALEVRQRQSFRDAVRHLHEHPQRLAERLLRAQARQRERAAQHLQALAGRLGGLDPRRVLARGYAWITDEQGRPLASARTVVAGQSLVAVWHDGRARATVDEVSADPPQ